MDEQGVERCDFTHTHLGHIDKVRAFPEARSAQV